MLLRIYKNSLSFWLTILFGKGCVYTPTCSEYARGAIDKHGIFKGTWCTLKRLFSCHPFSKGGYDPVK